MPLHPDPYTQNVRLRSAMEATHGTAAHYALKNTRSANVWRAYFERTLRSYMVAMEASVEVADDDWRAQFRENIERGLRDLKKAKEFDAALDTFTATIMRQSYLQLGQGIARPVGDRQKPVSLHPSNWTLNGFRSVQYVVTAQQAKKQHERGLRRLLGGLGPMRDLMHRHKQSGDPRTFEEWLRAEGILSDT